MSRLKFLFDIVLYSKINQPIIKRSGVKQKIDSSSKLGKFLRVWIMVPFVFIWIPFLMNVLVYDKLLVVYMNVRNLNEIGSFDIFLVTVTPIVCLILLVIVIMAILLPSEYKEI